MTIEQQANFLKIIDEDFHTMTTMLKRIQENISSYPVSTQMEFYKFLKNVIFIAWEDTLNKEDNFLINYKEDWDNIEI